MYELKTCHPDYPGESGGEIEIMSLFDGEMNDDYGDYGEEYGEEFAGKEAKEPTEV